MPDPNSTALTDFQVHRVDLGHPLWREYKLAKRMQILRRDSESGELTGIVALGTLVAGHTLVKPEGDAAALTATEITSRLITVSTDGSARTLTLPAAADFIGELVIVVEAVAAGGTLLISGAGATDITYDESDDPVLCLLVSDGTSWYAAAGAAAGNQESLIDVTS